LSGIIGLVCAFPACVKRSATRVVRRITAGAQVVASGLCEDPNHIRRRRRRRTHLRHVELGVWTDPVKRTPASAGHLPDDRRVARRRFEVRLAAMVEVENALHLIAPVDQEGSWIGNRGRDALAVGELGLDGNRPPWPVPPGSVRISTISCDIKCVSVSNELAQFLLVAMTAKFGTLRPPE
jgi:hypothetical protein